MDDSDYEDDWPDDDQEDDLYGVDEAVDPLPLGGAA
jgi:hypothetical protein